MIKQTAIFNEPFFIKNPEHDSTSNNTLKRFPLTENKNFVPSKFGPKRQKNKENDTVFQKNKKIKLLIKLCHPLQKFVILKLIILLLITLPLILK